MLLDSNIIIYAAEPGYHEVRKFIAENKSQVSVISKVEVLGYHKLNTKNKDKLEIIFQSLPILILNEEIIAKAILLRQQQKISLGDSLIGATALFYDLSIVTANVKDFSWIDNLEIINPIKNSVDK
jgi:toxin FitB